jgi:putative sugar O-methyltransferase
MNRKLFTQSIRDFNRCSLYKGASDTWLKTNKIIKKGFDYENFKTFQSNTNFYSIIGIEAHPSLTFNNFEEKKIFDSLIKTEESNIGAPHKNIRLKNKNFSAYYLTNVKMAAKIINLIGPQKKCITIFEIGGGVGLLSSILLSKINCKIILCDLPQTLALQKFFLSSIFKSKKHNFVANNNDNYKENFDINYVNCNQIFKKEFSFDLAINVNSFQEMKLETINKYIKFIELNLKDEGIFLHENTVGHSTGSSIYPSGYNLPNNFKIKNVEYNFPSGKGIWCPFFTVVCKKEKQNKIKPSLINKRKKILKQFYKLSSSKPLFYEKSKTKKIVIQMLNSKQSNKNLYKLNLDTNNSKKKLTELKINSIFQKINDALISDFNNLDHSFKLTKLTTNNVFKNKKIFDDPYWGVKISSISYGIKNYGDMNKSLDLIKNKSFDVLFRKLIFYFRTRDLAKADKLYNLLIAHSNHDFISDIKILYSSILLEKNSLYKKNLDKLLKKISNKNQAVLLSTIILNKDFDEYFYFIDKKKYFSKYMSNEDLVEILISQKKKILINNKNSRFLKKIDFRNKNYLSNLILQFKFNIIDESFFIDNLKRKIVSDYYLVGKALLKTFPELSKKNILYLVNRSSDLRKNNFMNQEFLGNILLHSGLYKDAIDKFKKIKTVDKNIFAPNLKYQICHSIIRNPSFKKYLENQRLSFITFEDQRIFFPALKTENSSRIL